MTEKSTRSAQSCKLWLGLGLAAGAWAGITLWQRHRARQESPLRETGKRRAALVTGASSGIGAAFARQLARRGYDLILVARREARLQALAEELAQRHGINVEVLVADLADPAGLAQVEAHVAGAHTLNLLVNNAGFGIPGSFIENDPERQEAMIRVHIEATMRLTRAALPGMLARGRGGVINVSSMVSFFPLAGSVVYAATKSYLTAFTEGLHEELGGTGVRVQALCPGFIRSEFKEVAEFSAPLPRFVWMSPESVAKQSLRDLDEGRVISIPGLGYRLLGSLSGLIPRGLLYAVGAWRRPLRRGQPDAFGGYHKRTYSSVQEFLDDMRFMRQNRPKIRASMHLLDSAFRERLMLAVTQVNGCRYCASYHSKLALEGGLSPEEVEQLLSGVIEHCPPDEVTAILYAQHWAETAGHPEPEIREKLAQAYGEEKAGAIEVVLHMIGAGNYLGNTFDSFLYRISGGRWGN
jgi:hypothetical protein